jgi:hypothetical protein
MTQALTRPSAEGNLSDLPTAEKAPNCPLNFSPDVMLIDERNANSEPNP